MLGMKGGSGMEEGRIQPIMDLIEATLDADITAQELADQAGYSLWHFCRLFQLEVGMPLMRYRTRRRLAHALWAISQGESVTGAALRYGFDTHAGFYKAFCREYGCSPTDYLKAHPAFMPWPLQLREEQYLMLTHENWQKILSAWNLAELPLRPVVSEPTGFVADNVIYAGDSYVLKAYLDPARCGRTLSLTRALSAAGMAVALPQPLPDGRDALDAIEAVLPAGTLSGAPKIRACQLIGELENNKRGIYGGAIGYIDFTGNMDTCIAIRIAYKKNGKVFVRSGAGIVADSVPEKEYEECINKARAVMNALKLAEEEEQ